MLGCFVFDFCFGWSAILYFPAHTVVNYWKHSTELVVFAVSMKGLEDYADFCGGKGPLRLRPVSG